MAAATFTSHSHINPKADHFSISSLISRFRSKRRRSSVPVSEKSKDSRPPLNHSPLPLVLSGNQGTLGKLGWTVVTFPQPKSEAATSSPLLSPEEINTPETTTHDAPSADVTPPPVPGLHPLQQASAALFAVSQAFFDLPDEEKAKWKTRLGSEEGWSKIPGEKEFITLRTLSYTPDVLKGPAKTYWDLMGSYLDTCLGRINSSLGLEAGEIGSGGEEVGLRKFVGPCKRLGENEEDKTATMLRLFRYEGWEEKIVAEPHADLGLLSIVVGDVPGLEVWGGNSYLPIEKNYTTPSASLLAGRQLEKLSNGRYPAGGHRVVSYGKPKQSTSTLENVKETPKYRFSIVFVLRAYEPAIVDSDLLETKVTGKWKEPVRGVSAGTMYDQIRRAHFNINTGLEEREEQRRKLAESKRKSVMGTG